MFLGCIFLKVVFSEFGGGGLKNNFEVFQVGS